MIKGIGTDIVNIERIAKLYKKDGRRLIERILSQKEQTIMAEIALEEKQIAYLAKRFAGKEAVSKALGTGIVAGLNFADISILNNEQGRPFVQIEDTASIAREIEPSNINISLSDDYPFAIAFVVIQG